MKKQLSRAPTYYLLTLGCPKNTVDSEGMAMLLHDDGYGGTTDPEAADVLIVNTCGFLESAAEESIGHLQQLARGKHGGQLLIAAGCMAERASERIVREVPGVDGLLGTRRWMEIVPLLREARSSGSRRAVAQYALLGDPEEPFSGPVPRPPVHLGSAYLKISDGCDAPCAYCAIPAIKGAMRSRPANAIIAEASRLVASGAQEVILIAQDTTSFGRDWGETDALPALIHSLLAATPDLRWLRLMYAYPGRITMRLVETMAEDPRVCHYLDIPLQHGHPATLRRMLRPSDTEAQLRTLASLREAMPDIALRSTFIVGFPGETEGEFQGLLDLLQRVQFDKVGVFTFSPEPGTRAAVMPDQVPPEVAHDRYERAMAAQQRISLARNASQVGRVLDVLVESSGTDPGHEGTLSIGRSYRDAPEVDGTVIVPAPMEVGKMAQVRITGALEYDLLAETVKR